MKDRTYAIIGLSIVAIGLITLFVFKSDDPSVQATPSMITNKTTINDCYDMTGSIYSRDYAAMCSILVLNNQIIDLQKQVNELKAEITEVKNSK